jgi:hypothetical protein
MSDTKRLAELFHEAYEKQAVKANWKTQKSCRAKPFSELPKENQETMIATAKEVLKYYTEKAELLSLVDGKIKELEAKLEAIKRMGKKPLIDYALGKSIGEFRQIKYQIDFLQELKEKLK